MRRPGAAPDVKSRPISDEIPVLVAGAALAGTGVSATGSAAGAGGLLGGTTLGGATVGAVGATLAAAGAFAGRAHATAHASAPSSATAAAMRAPFPVTAMGSTTGSAEARPPSSMGAIDVTTDSGVSERVGGDSIGTTEIGSGARHGG